MRSALEWAQVRALARTGSRSARSRGGWGSIGGRSRGWSRRDEPPRYSRAPAGSMLDPLEPVLRRLLEEWPEIKAPRVTEILRDDYGYAGSVDLVRRAPARLRPSQVRPAQRTGYRPGQVLQLDWAEMPTRPRIAGRERRVYALVATLPYSGAQTAFFSFEMTIESFLEGHVRIFDWLGGVPRECVYDNLRSVVARRERDDVTWNRRFLHLRGHYALPRAPPARRRRRARRARSRAASATSRAASGRPGASRLLGRARRAVRRLARPGLQPAASTRPAASRSTSGSPHEREALRPLPPTRFDFVGRAPDPGAARRLPAATAAASTGRRERLVHSASSCASTATRSGSRHRGREVARYPRSYDAGRLVAAAAACAPSRPLAAPPRVLVVADGRAARAGRLRRALRMSTPTAGERLPYLLASAEGAADPRAAPATAERRPRARAGPTSSSWRRSRGRGLRPRRLRRPHTASAHAGFPAPKTLEDFDCAAQPGAERPLDPAPRPARLDRGARQRLLPRPARHRQDPPRDRARRSRPASRPPHRFRHRPGMGRPPRASAAPQPARRRAAPARALPPAGRRRDRLPPARAPGRQPALRARLPPLRTRLDHRHLQPRLRAVGRDPRRRHGRRRPHRPARPPRHHDHAQRQELPPARTRRRSLRQAAPAGPTNRTLMTGGAESRRLRRLAPTSMAHFSIPESGSDFGSC